MKNPLEREEICGAGRVFMCHAKNMFLAALLCKNFIKIFYLFKTVFAIIRKAIVKKS